MNYERVAKDLMFDVQWRWQSCVRAGGLWLRLKPLKVCLGKVSEGMDACKSQPVGLPEMFAPPLWLSPHVLQARFPRRDH